MQDSHSFWMASIIRGHQKYRAAKFILLMAVCPLCSRLMTVLPKFFCTIFLSSMKTRPNLLDNFLLNVWSSSGISSCCCLSRHTRVFNSLRRSWFLSLTAADRWKNSFPFLALPVPDSSHFILRQLFLVRDPFSHMEYFSLRRYVPRLSAVLLKLTGVGPFLNLFHFLPWAPLGCSYGLTRMLTVRACLIGPESADPSPGPDRQSNARRVLWEVRSYEASRLSGPDSLSKVFLVPVAVVDNLLQFF